MNTVPVYLVGAGPGDPELITLKGLRVLQQADVIVYDELVDRALLDHSRPDCELIPLAGHGKDQDAVCRLLVAWAQSGKAVVRLKGGDPFVFGRGGEEAVYLAEHGVPCVVVPGVSSAIAAPAYAGIPVTHRGIAASFAVVTGHEAASKVSAAVVWTALARAVDTLVILMGLANLPTIAMQLVQAGKDPGTPAAVISRGTWPDQVTVISTLEHVAEVTRANGLRPPAVIVVGEVVRLAGALENVLPAAVRLGRQPPEPGGLARADDRAGLIRSQSA